METRFFIIETGLPKLLDQQLDESVITFFAETTP